MTDRACRPAVRRARRWRPGVRTAGLACALAALLVLPPGTAGAAVAGRAGPALSRAPAAGPLVAWGYNSSGQLGDGNQSDQRVAVRTEVPGVALAIGPRPLSYSDYAVVRKIID